MEHRTLKNILIWAIAIVVILGGGFLGYNYYMNYESGKLEAKKHLKEISGVIENLNKEKEESNKDTATTELKSLDYYPAEDVYDILHRMANTKIIAEDDEVWGKIPIDSESLSDIKALVSEMDYEDKDYLLKVLNRWENGDFSQADKEHNYFWAKLGGTIGKAIKIKK